MNFETLYSQTTQEIKAGQFESALNKSIQLFELATEPMQQLYALLLKVNILTALSKSDELLKTYDEIIGLFGDSEDETIQFYLASSYYYKAELLKQCEHVKESIEAYEAMIQIFASHPSQNIQELVAKAMNNKASRQGDLEAYEEALATYDEVIKHYEKSDGELLNQYAIALHNKAILLSQLQHEKEMMAVCDTIIEKFENHGDEMIREMVETAKVIKDKDQFTNNAY